MKKTGFIALLLTLFIAMPMKGQIRGNSINVEVIPDHQDWRYEVGEIATFNIKVTREHTLINNVTVDYDEAWLLSGRCKSHHRRQGI